MSRAPVELTADEIANLTPDEQDEYEALLEEAYWGSGQQSFRDFCSLVEVPGVPSDDYDEDIFFPVRVEPARHHRLLIDAIQKLADGTYHDVDGVMVFFPPGAAKSTYLSVLAPAWLMGRKKGTNVIGTSYAQPVINRFSRRVRQICRSTDFNKIMETGVVGDNQDVENWSLANGSEYRAAGLNASVTSFRADWVLIDDPVKGREDADSELIREKTWQTLNDDVFTRMKPDAKIVIAMTRWHEDDPAARILGEKWKGQSGFWRGTDERLWLVINLPLLAEHKDDPLKRKLNVHQVGKETYGELLWPEWFRIKEALRLAKISQRGGTAARTWSSLYQQRPAPNEGAILPKSYWRPWTKEDLPECEYIYLFYDTAFEEDEQNDPSAMTAWGVFENVSKKPTGEEYNHYHIILLGAWNEQVDAVRLKDIAVDGWADDNGVRHPSHCQLFKPTRLIIEKRASGIVFIQELRKKRVPAVAWLPPGKPGAKGKIPRAHSAAAILEQGSVWYVPGTKTEMVLDQCAAFPFAKHDDLCFVAGTLIATKRGLLPIEDVKVGDLALTPLGWRKVTAAGFTGIRPVIQRGNLIGTANHPVFTLDAGFKNLDTVTMATASKATLWNLIRTIRLRPWISGVSLTDSWAGSADIIFQRPKQTEVEREQRDFTSRFGSTITSGQFRRVTRFITRTAIHSIAALRIWSAYRSLFIARWRSELTAKSKQLISNLSGRWPQSGIDPMRGGLGTARTLNARASCSRESLPHFASFTAFANVWSAVKNLSAGIPGGSYAATHVPAVAPVFNLSVEGVHCYYANGVLVHNCDTVTMALIYFRNKHIFKTHEDELDEDELKEAMIEKSEKRRAKRTLYSGPVNRGDDYDEADIASMTPETRRRLYG